MDFNPIKLSVMNFRSNLNFLALVILTPLIVGLSCAGPDKKAEWPLSVKEIRLASANNNKTMPLSALYEIESYIPLETGDSILIGEISKLMVYNDAFWVLDRITLQILGFSNEGKLFTAIDKKGEGPGMYQHISDIAVSEDAVYVLNAYSKTMLKYDWNGEFIDEKKADLSSTHFEVLPEGGFAFYHDYLNNERKSGGEIQYNLTLTDEDLNIKSQYLINNLAPAPEFLIGNQKNFSRNNNSLLVFESYQNIIYQIQEDSVQSYLKFYISDNEYQNMAKLFENTNSMNWSVTRTMDFELENEIGRIVELQENDRFIVITYFKKDICYLTYYDKKNDRVLELQKRMTDHAPPIALSNDMDNTIFYPLVAAQGDYFYSFTDAYQLTAGDVVSERVNGLLEKLPDDPNPIIVKLKIKSF